MSIEERPATGKKQHEINLSWGRTIDGKLFKVPETRDMLQNLFLNFPPTRKTHNFFELVTLGTIAFQILLFFYVYFATWNTGISFSWKIYFMCFFLFFRLSYNAGLGVVLKTQSDSKRFTNLCKNSALFDKEASEKSNNLKKLHVFLKRELSLKMGSDYDFDTAPIEFNSWLLYRQLVDFILINDFVAYIIFSLAFFNVPEWTEIGLLDILRYVCGMALIAFNAWVKLDAHRVVKDFAWYWGDFFFLVDANLTFDGVFEMCFHPMYSVGYAGYYGVSMITNAYTVLFVSLLAHAAQFIFLYTVEEPHIKKIYGSSSDSLMRGDVRAQNILYGKDPHHGYFRRDLIVFKNFDIFRATDIILAWSVFTTIFTGLPILSYLNISLSSWIFLLHAAFWRLFHTFGLGLTLRYQSRTKMLTEHFIKFGGTNKDAFSSWKTIYNFSLTMTYTTFIVATMNTFEYPLDLTDLFRGPFLLRQVIGSLLILIHVWMSFSVFDVLGDFGWFYGDFFIDEFPAELHYTGIYRYLNNPEKTLGLAAFWGMALISGDWMMFLLAVLSHFSNWWFLEYVETPHMKKLYGAKMRKESGVSKTIRNQLANPVINTLEMQNIVSEVNKVIHDVNKIGSEVVQKVEELVSRNV